MERKPSHAFRPRPGGRGHFPFWRTADEEPPVEDGIVELDDEDLEKVAGGGDAVAAVSGREPGFARN